MRKQSNISKLKVITLIIILCFIFALVYIATVNIEINSTEVNEDISGQLFTNER